MEKHASRFEIGLRWILNVGIILCVVGTIAALIIPSQKAPVHNHRAEEVTEKRLLFWSEATDKFCECNKRAPSTVNELQLYVKKQCVDQSLDYEVYSKDGWGHQIKVTFIDSKSGIREVLFTTAGSNSIYESNDTHLSTFCSLQ